jgi:hypothetical protein
VLALLQCKHGLCQAITLNSWCYHLCSNVRSCHYQPVCICLALTKHFIACTSPIHLVIAGLLC